MPLRDPPSFLRHGTWEHEAGRAISRTGTNLFTPTRVEDRRQTVSIGPGATGEAGLRRIARFAPSGEGRNFDRTMLPDDLSLKHLSGAILPVQYFDPIKWWKFLDGERRLLFAVLEEAVRTYLTQYERPEQGATDTIRRGPKLVLFTHSPARAIRLGVNLRSPGNRLRHFSEAA